MDSNAARSDDSQQINNAGVKEAVDLVSPKTKNQTSNVLRQHLDETSVLKNASAGTAVRGLLINHGNIENVNTVIDIVGEICMKGCEMKYWENDLDFSTKQKHNEYHKSIESFAVHGRYSLNAASFLGLGISGSYMKDKDEKSNLHEEQVFHSRVHCAFVPVKACELKLENFVFVPDALKRLKDIETLAIEKKDFDTIHSSIVKFFKHYGSHVNIGVLHFGGIYEWTAKYESEHKTNETFSANILNRVLEAYVSGGKSFLNKYVGGTCSGDVIMKETHFSGNYDQGELSKVVCGVSIYGGSPDSLTFNEWKTRLQSENSTWNIIDKNELIEIWEILSNHCTDLDDNSRLFQLMKASFYIEFELDSKIRDIPQSTFPRILDTFQQIIESVCENPRYSDYFNGMMNLQLVQDVFSHMIFITRTSTDEYFVSKVKTSLKTIVEYMTHLDNSVKKSIVSWIGDSSSTQTYNSGIFTGENIQDVEGLYSVLKDKFLPFFNRQTRRDDKALNELVKKELTSVCLWLLSSLQKANVFHYALFLSQLQIFNYDVNNHLFPDFDVFNGLIDLINDLESCIEVYRVRLSHSVNDQAVVVSGIILNMEKYNVSNKEVVFDQCLHPVRPMLHAKIVEALNLCTDSLPYKWSNMRHKIALLTKPDDYLPYVVPFSDQTCHERIDRTEFDFQLTESATQMLEKLGLLKYFPNKIDFIDAISLPSQTSNQLNVHSLPKMVLNDIMMVNRQARDYNLWNNLKIFKKTNKPKDDNIRDSDDEDDGNEVIEKINPLDILVAIFYCSSFTLQHVIADRLFSCCIAIPFVFPPDADSNLILLKSTLRAIVINLKSKGRMYQNTAFDIPGHVLSFIRLGRPEFSKSYMINKFLASGDCQIFFNQDCTLGDSQRKLSNGLIEFSLFPEPKTSSMFALNLRGDGLEFKNSVRMLSGISSVVVVCLKAEHLKHAYTLERLNVINDCAKAVVLVLDGSKLNLKEIKTLRKNYNQMLPSEYENKTSLFNLRAENKQVDFSTKKDIFHKIISKHLKDQSPSKMADRIKDKIKVDEDCFDLKEKENASSVLLHFPHRLIDFKRTVLPLQTTVLPDVCANYKKLHNSCNIIGLKQNDIFQDLLLLREKQLQIMGSMHPFMTTFISVLLLYKDRLDQMNKFVVWVKFYMDDKCRDGIQDVLSDECQPDNRLNASAIGFEHLMREVAQIFESCSALKSQCESNTWTRVSKFPAIAAQLLLKGQPIEIMDGDIGYVPLEWIQAIFKELGDKLSDKKCLVLSIIGIQSSGKSTLLNTMFGLTFPVSAGRCSKGVSMRVVPVSRNDFQYILVLDTEGLRAATKGNDMKKFDNEIATFVIGLADINIVNIQGEGTSEIQEIMSMAICSLLRLKLGNQNINIHQTCLFVHQNVNDTNAYEMTERERNMLISILDSMTSAAAELIHNYEIKKFSDVINFNPHENIFHIPDLWSKVGDIKYRSSGYSESVAELKGKIMKLASFERYLPFSNLILRIQDIWTGILGDSFVFDFSNSLSMKAYDEMIKQFLELKWNLHRIGENELNKAECVLIAVNNNHTEYAENMKSDLLNAMKVDKTKHMNTLNEFINNSHLKHLMTHWRSIIISKLQTEQEKIIWTLEKDYEKMVERVKLERERSLRQTEYEEDLLKLVRNLNEDERKNEYDLERRFDEHWTLWSQKIIPRLHTSLPSLKEKVHQLVNESCDDKIKSYVREYMSQPDDKRIQNKGILLNSLTIADIDISVLNVKRHRTFFIFKRNVNDMDCKQDALILINIIFSEIDAYLRKSIQFVSQFETRLALMPFSIISSYINTFQSDTCTLTPKFHAMLLSHVAKYLINYFTRVHTKEEVKQRKFRNQQQDLMYQFVLNVAENNIAANYFLMALVVGMIEHVSTKIPGKIADFIIKEFSHSKKEVIRAILLDLAEKDQFHLFKMYIDEPREFANLWITQHTNREIFAIIEGTQLTLYSKIAKDILAELAPLLKTGIKKAAKSFSKSLPTNNPSWIITFSEEMMRGKIFPLKPENIRFIQRQVTDFELFSDALLQQFDGVEHDVFKVFLETTVMNVEWKESPYTKIIAELWGCDAKCPFCSETCIHSDINHLELGKKHKCLMHRPQGIGDMKVTKTRYLIFKREVLEVENCNYLIGTSKTYEKPGLSGQYRFSNFRNDYIDWEIQSVSNTRPEYWMWFFCEYGHDLEMVNGGIKLPTIPENRKIRKEIAIESLGFDGTY